MIELIENETDILCTRLSFRLCGSNHRLQRIFRGGSWRRSAVMQTDMTVGKEHHSRCVRMLDGNDDVSMADEILNLCGIGEGRIRDSVGKENDRELSCMSDRNSIVDRVGGNGTGNDLRPSGAKHLLCCCFCPSIAVK